MLSVCGMALRSPRVNFRFGRFWEGDMDAKQPLMFGASMPASGGCGSALSEEAKGQYVRIAELEIDPAQLEGFKSAIKEGIETAVRVEPGVLALYAVSEKDDPARVRVFEIYTDAEAYKTHLETPHFRKFRATTEKMVRSRKLIDAIPIVLGVKAK
jgi:quinol monooxygenase YgiN